MAAVVKVELWGRQVGAVAWPEGQAAAAFEYDPHFITSGIEVAPLMMPLSTRVFRFPELPWPAFRGLPGLLADVLPDRFGNALIDAWLARQGRTPDSFSTMERLCYLGRRAMGAVSFQPALGPAPGQGEPLVVAELVALASTILRQREGLAVPLGGAPDGFADILRVGTSAGGARAKALIAWNPASREVRSGQVEALPGFSQWLIKFDGVSANRDRELADPQGFGAIEYAYHLMARDAGLTMSECRLLEEGGRRHFLTRRFDRTEAGGRLHLQSLAALAHLDFNAAGAYGYEHVFLVMRHLRLPMAQIEQQFRRMVFNVVARNQDDHVKNIAFLMDKTGAWSLSPAFDVTWSYNPAGEWTSAHQMTVNGKRDGFAATDFEAVGELASLKRGRSAAILAEVVEAVRRWALVAGQVGVSAEWVSHIRDSHRLRW